MGGYVDLSSVCTQSQHEDEGAACFSAVQIANLNDHLSDPAAINGFNAATKFVVGGASFCCFASWCVPLSLPFGCAYTPGTYSPHFRVPSCSQESKRRDPASQILNIIDAAFAPMGTWAILNQITVKHSMRWARYGC